MNGYTYLNLPSRPIKKYVRQLSSVRPPLERLQLSISCDSICVLKTLEMSTENDSPISTVQENDLFKVAGDSLSNAEKAKIERNRQKALLLRQSRLIPHPYARINTDTDEKSVVKIQGSKFIDTGGGFLIEEDGLDDDLLNLPLTQTPAPIVKPDRPSCLECQEEFADSYLFQTFDYAVCDKCRDNEDKHALITKTDAKNEYLLKDCDLDKREPPLKFITRKNPHNVRWGEMKLYLQLQVEERALEVWGSEEKILEEKEKRVEKKEKSKVKKYNKQIKALRMSVRSSLYDHTSSSSHEHEFNDEVYNEDDDTYSRTCESCGFEESYEKM